VEQIMGLPVSIHLRGSGCVAGREAAVAAVFAELREVDRVFSPFRPDSDIARLGRGEVEAADCDPAVAEVLSLCDKAFAQTDGYFDAWRPDADGTRKLDPSGLVKGWAVQRATRHLAELGEDWYLNAGGDIALGLGSPDSPPWRIGVEDPFRPQSLLGVLALSSGGVATSGSVHRGAHIVDPHTGAPAVALVSVTVVGPSLLWADVLATAAVARGEDAVEALDWPSGYDVLAVTSDRRARRSPGMRRLLSDPPQ
jgi:thiamine biosynthesis lipoprotein